MTETFAAFRELLDVILALPDALLGVLGGVILGLALCTLVGIVCWIGATVSTMKRSLREEFWWAVHNLIAHPLSEPVYWLFGERAAGWVHDITVPKHKKGTGRG